MFCSKCGREASDSDKFCSQCGDLVVAPVESEPLLDEPIDNIDSAYPNIWINASDMDHVFLILSKEITILSMMLAESLESEDRASDGFSTCGSVAIELAIILLHMVDRSALKCLGPEERGKFMDQAYKVTVDEIVHLMGKMGNQEEDVKSFMVERLNERQTEYSAFQVYITDDLMQEDNNSIFWRFAKNVATVQKNDENILISELQFGSLLIMDMIHKLKIEELFKLWPLLIKK